MQNPLQYCKIVLMLAIKQPLTSPILRMRKEKHIGLIYTNSCASRYLFTCLKVDDLVATFLQIPPYKLHVKR